MPVFLFSFLVQLDWKWSLIVSVVCVWPYNHQKMSTQRPVESLSGKATTAEAMWPQHLSVWKRKEAIFQSYFLSRCKKKLKLQWSAVSVTPAELIQSRPTAYHDIALDFKSICSKTRHVWPRLIWFVALEILPHRSPLQTAAFLK